MASFAVKIEKEDVNTNTIGANFMLTTKEGFQIIFSSEAMEELIADYGQHKGQPLVSGKQAAGNHKLTALSELGLCDRPYNRLREAGVNTVEELLKMSVYDLFRLPGIGKNCVSEIEHTLQQMGLGLKFK
ncbi:hypothetical protein GCM10027299_21800 [Larkinella ripae]